LSEKYTIQIKRENLLKGKMENEFILKFNGAEFEFTVSFSIWKCKKKFKKEK
jgi:hypothetical protein